MDVHFVGSINWVHAKKKFSQKVRCCALGVPKCYIRSIVKFIGVPNKLLSYSDVQ